MVSMLNAGIVLAICIIGVGYSSYKLGLRRGAEALVDLLVEQGVLVEDSDEEA
jgi:hypothetical protein